VTKGLTHHAYWRAWQDGDVLIGINNVILFYPCKREGDLQQAVTKTVVLRHCALRR